MKKITILIPTYNERENIPSLYTAVKKEIQIHKEKYTFDYLFVDDGSTDDTVDILEVLTKKDKKVKLVELSRNFGKEIALTAGIHHVKSDALIIMDADLQHPPEVISSLILKWEAGADIVTTHRVHFKNRSLLKKLGSKLFYKTMNFIGETEMASGSTDFRLLDKIVVDALRGFTERNRLVRGLTDWMGFKKSVVEFSAPDRTAGKPGYTVTKLIDLAINSLTSYSLLPLKLAGYLGVIISSVFGLLFAWMLVDKYILDNNTYSSLSYVIVANSFFVGIVLMALGMTSLYIGYIHTEVTNRPLFIIRKKVNVEDEVS